jgi:hypothetical protein
MSRVSMCVALSAGMFWGGGCIFEPGPDAPGFQFVRLISSSDPSVSEEFVLVDEQNLGAGEQQLPGVANDVGAVEYDIANDRRLFLFEQDLQDGIRLGEYLQLPETLDPLEDSRVVIDDPDKWQSFRAYDVGMCSQLRSWELFADPLVGFPANFADGFEGNLSVEGVNLVSSAVTPIIQAAPRNTVLSRDADGMRVAIEMTAQRVSIPITPGDVDDCFDATVRVDMTLRLASDDTALLSFPPFGFMQQPQDFPDECPGTGSSGGIVELPPDGFSRDIFATVETVEAEVSGCGILNGMFGDAFAESLRENTPQSSRFGFLDQFLLNPRQLGLPGDVLRPCQCDNQCNRFAPGGPAFPGERHKCHFIEPGASCETDADCDRIYHENPDAPGYSCDAVTGTCVADFFPIIRGECWVQLEPDRVNARPDGIEFVVIGPEDDPQASLVQLDRNGDGVPDGSFGRSTCDPEGRGWLGGPGAVPTGGLIDSPF